MSIKLVVPGRVGTNVKDRYWLGLDFQKAMPGFSDERSRIDNLTRGLNTIKQILR
ncbi:hypothetical protein [Pedobacter psychrodurus]|uniref:hypothetical protein n=1 Tax=Pedobacter psychrodurus TaxID=2530456 RepID=UPI0013F1504C|nr:hypothetical protein [Pedobacter psychrodurus]